MMITQNKWDYESVLQFLELLHQFIKLVHLEMMVLC